MRSLISTAPEPTSMVDDGEPKVEYDLTEGVVLE